MIEPDFDGAIADLRHLTAQIVVAYVSNNSVGRTDLGEVIVAIHGALASLDAAEPAHVAERPTPAVSIRKSVTPEHLISLEDGKLYKSLKRHLAGRGMTPADYKAKWGLPANYPMTAPSYSARRSELAKSFGLGRKRQGAAKAAPLKSVARLKAA